MLYCKLIEFLSNNKKIKVRTKFNIIKTRREKSKDNEKSSGNNGWWHE